MNIEEFLNEKNKGTNIDTPVKIAIVGIGMLCQKVSNKQYTEKVQSLLRQSINADTLKKKYQSVLNRIISKMMDYNIAGTCYDLIEYVIKNISSKEEDGTLSISKISPEEVTFLYYLGLTRAKDINEYNEQKKNPKNN